MNEFSNGNVSMNAKAKNVFHKDLKLNYEHDFGSTTELQLTVLDEYYVKTDDELILLSRNEPIKGNHVANLYSNMCYS